MTLELRSIVGRGDVTQERLTLRATRNLDVGDFAVLRVPYIDEMLMTDVKHAFWFPFGEVEKGDLVVIYSKKGVSRNKILSTGKTAHFFYWESGVSLWEDTDYAAVVLQVSDWSFKGVRELAESR